MCSFLCLLLFSVTIVRFSHIGAWINSLVLFLSERVPLCRNVRENAGITRWPAYLTQGASKEEVWHTLLLKSEHCILK